MEISSSHSNSKDLAKQVVDHTSHIKQKIAEASQAVRAHLNEKKIDSGTYAYQILTLVTAILYTRKNGLIDPNDYILTLKKEMEEEIKRLPPKSTEFKEKDHTLATQACLMQLDLTQTSQEKIEPSITANGHERHTLIAEALFILDRLIESPTKEEPTHFHKIFEIIDQEPKSDYGIYKKTQVVKLYYNILIKKEEIKESELYLEIGPEKEAQIIALKQLIEAFCKQAIQLGLHFDENPANSASPSLFLE